MKLNLTALPPFFFRKGYRTRSCRLRFNGRAVPKGSDRVVYTAASVLYRTQQCHPSPYSSRQTKKTSQPLRNSLSNRAVQHSACRWVNHLRNVTRANAPGLTYPYPGERLSLFQAPRPVAYPCVSAKSALPFQFLKGSSRFFLP